MSDQKWTLRQWVRWANHLRIDWGRSLLFKLSRGLFNRPGRVPQKNASLAGYLVLRLDGKLGDTVTATGFIYSLVQSLRHPNQKVYILANPHTAFIYQGMPRVEILVYKKSLSSALGIWFKLSRLNFLATIQTTHLFRASHLFFLWAMRSQQRIGFGEAAQKLKSIDTCVAVNINADHVTKRYLAILKALNITPSLDYNISHLKLADKPMPQKPYIVLNAFAGGSDRCFTREAVAFLIKYLERQYPHHLVVTVGSSYDQKTLHKWRSQYPDLKERWVIWDKAKSFIDNLSVVAGCELLVTPDTAWVHLASALQKPMWAFYFDDREQVERTTLVWAPYKTSAQIYLVPLSWSGGISAKDMEQALAKGDQFHSIFLNP